MEAERWLPPNEVAERLGFDPKTIRRWCIRSQRAMEAGDDGDAIFPNARKWPDDSPQARWRIPESDVRSFIGRRRQEQPKILTDQQRIELTHKLLRGGKLPRDR